MAVFQAATKYLLLSALPRNGGIALMSRKNLLLKVYAIENIPFADHSCAAGQLSHTGGQEHY